MGFLVICVGIVILQMSKVDPVSLSKLDRRSTILLQAARSKTEAVEEKDALGVEDPGMDALRGSFGTFGSIIRARSARRMSLSSNLSAGAHRIRPVGASAPVDRESGLRPWSHGSIVVDEHPSGLKRHQLYDAPMPVGDINSTSSVQGSPLMGKRPTIKFDSQDLVHQYDRPGTGDAHVTEHRRAVGTPVTPVYPPLPPLSVARTEGLPPPPTSTTNLLGTEEELSRIDERSSSAPPTMNPQAGFPFPGARKNLGRADSRDLFSSSAGTLLSFPSVTDSARSETWENETKRGSDRGRSHKRYPKGAGDDDREESMSLWQTSGEQEEEEEGPSPVSTEEALGGIRLVTPPPRASSRF
ncbi:hypothetical protein C0991_001405 [Blastosporella zonata]|nr:hypothetical protein C0991_001405 [Blastosporella zonata]